jgi:hypothetical protein
MQTIIVALVLRTVISFPLYPFFQPAMVEETGPFSTVAATMATPPRAAWSALQRADDAVGEWLRDLSRRGQLAYGLLMGLGALGSLAYVATLSLRLLVGTAAAQDGGGLDAAGEAMCGSGLGQAITIAFGFLAGIMVLVGVARGATGFQKMGSARSDKKQEGKEQMKGAAYAFGGVFFLIMAPGLLELIGLSTFSCVNLAPF